jgi:hypothetical protein
MNGFFLYSFLKIKSYWLYVMKKNTDNLVSLPIALMGIITSYLTDESLGNWIFAVMHQSDLKWGEKIILLGAIQNRQKYLIEKFSLCIAPLNKIIQDPYDIQYLNEQDALWDQLIPASPKSPSKDLHDYQDNVQQLIMLSKAMLYVPYEMLSDEDKRNSQQFRSLNRSQKKFGLLKFFEERLSMYRAEANYQVHSLFLPLSLSFMLSCLLYFSVLAMSDPDSNLFNRNPYVYASGSSTALAILIWKVCSIVERYKSLKEKVSSCEEKIDKINKLNSGLSSAFIMLRHTQSLRDSQWISDDQAVSPSQSPQLLK